MGKISTKFVGRIILSAENSRIQFTIGRYGNLPYIGIWSIETGSTKFVGRISGKQRTLAYPPSRLANHSTIVRYGYLPYGVVGKIIHHFEVF